jgi:hypothetical protein
MVTLNVGIMFLLFNSLLCVSNFTKWSAITENLRNTGPNSQKDRLTKHHSNMLQLCRISEIINKTPNWERVENCRRFLADRYYGGRSIVISFRTSLWRTEVCRRLLLTLYLLSETLNLLRGTQEHCWAYWPWLRLPVCVWILPE